MAKQTRKQKKEEERRIIAELDAALLEEREAAKEEDASVFDAQKEERTGKEKRSRASFYESTQPKILHCRRCRAEMKEGVCPVCGYKTYVGMSEEKRKKIRAIVTAVCIGVFLVLFLVIKRI